jgi:adenylyl cyclase-associated protein
MDEKLQLLIQRLETATIKLEGLTSGSSVSSANSSSSGAYHVALSAFDSIINGPLKQYLDLSDEIGGLVKDQAAHLQNAIKFQRELIFVVVNSKKPNDAILMDLIKPLQTAIMATVDIKDKNRPSPLFNHLSAIAEGVPALGWVMVVLDY